MESLTKLALPLPVHQCTLSHAELPAVWMSQTAKDTSQLHARHDYCTLIFRQRCDTRNSERKLGHKDARSHRGIFHCTTCTTSPPFDLGQQAGAKLHLAKPFRAPNLLKLIPSRTCLKGKTTAKVVKDDKQ